MVPHGFTSVEALVDALSMASTYIWCSMCDYQFPYSYLPGYHLIQLIK